MDKRTRILSAVFLAVIVVVLVGKVVFPRWIDPLLRIDDRIAEKQASLDKLEETEARVADAKIAYRDLAARVGSTDINKVRNQVYSRLNDLIDSNHLENAKVTPTKRARTDKKTKLSRTSWTVSAQGTLESVVTFLKDVAELPYPCRINNPEIRPTSRSAKSKTQDRMSLKAAIEVMVLPDHRILPSRLRDEVFEQPEEFKRHLDRDYAMIWESRPFFEYEKPAPPRPVRKDPPKDPKPKQEPVKPKQLRWKDASRLQLCMAWLVDDGTTRRDEVMLFDTKSDRDRFVRVGEDFDGGSLLFVHQRGVLVGREDGDYVYPIGEKLDQPIRLADASDYPELQRAALTVVRRGVVKSRSETSTAGDAKGHDRETEETKSRTAGSRDRKSGKEKRAKRGKDGPSTSESGMKVRDSKKRLQELKGRREARKRKEASRPEPPEVVPGE